MNYIGTFYGFVNYVLDTPAMPYIYPVAPVGGLGLGPIVSVGGLGLGPIVSVEGLGWGPRRLLSETRINWVIFDELDPGFIYHTFSGVAPDTFQDDFIQFDFPLEMKSRIIVLLAWDNPVDIIFNLYGNDDLVNFDGEYGFVDNIPGKGFKIKNTYPGNRARYQLTVIN